MRSILGRVEYAAQVDNSWGVIAAVIAQEEHISPTLPHGYIAFGHRVADGLARGGFGTAQYVEQEDGSIIFNHGHYDMDLMDALADLAERADITRNGVAQETV